ncbi:conserved exported protein of unknown function [Nitrospira japonica]|uniref:Lipoprotein n=1 Tax=Nitrospira japonica TaxID=1325564 RepID=A0A1W1I4Y3_9BACT|nr:hypothetical protein [Nitrospira japonica]SLM47883.1 conserved exported protein of unknown function [Nitrospira japonica]
MAKPSYCSVLLRGVLSTASTLLLSSLVAFAVPLQHDPNGFEGIPWGAALSESETFGKTEEAGRLKTYEGKNAPPHLGPSQVESMKFTTIDDQFARVTVRYQGKATHDEILAYLQSLYGPLDDALEQFSVGPVKFYAWQGFETEVTLRYENRADRGIIFFESQTLRGKIADGNSATVF